MRIVYSEMSILRTVFLSYAYCATLTLMVALEQDNNSVWYDGGGHFPSASQLVEEPLLLTPFIEAGKIDEARNRSRNTPLLDDIESYSGFLTVNATTKSHLFFWYFPKTGIDDATAPLILWLDGGPGTSSLYGLLFENGPYEVTMNGFERRTHAWTNNYNMLYIDQPVGTGFSFTEANGYIGTEKEVGEHVHEALRQFYQLFAEFQHRDLYIAGVSYAGMYIPAVGHKIHSVNREGREGFEIPLKGMMIGNGFSDADTQYENAALLYDLGMIDGRERSELEKIQNEIKQLTRSRTKINDGDHRLFLEMKKMLGPVNMYDYTQDDSTCDRPMLSAISRALIRNRINKMLHVGRRKFDADSDRVLSDFSEDIDQTVRQWVEELLEHYRILFYSGQLDLVVPHSLTQNFLAALRWSGAFDFDRAKKQIWRFGKSVAGYYKVAGNLVYVVVRNAGHNVPLGQPKNALTMIDFFISKKFEKLSAINETE